MVSVLSRRSAVPVDVAVAPQLAVADPATIPVDADANIVGPLNDADADELSRRPVAAHIGVAVAVDENHVGPLCPLDDADADADAHADADADVLSRRLGVAIAVAVDGKNVGGCHAPPLL